MDKSCRFAWEFFKLRKESRYSAPISPMELQSRLRYKVTTSLRHPRGDSKYYAPVDVI